MGIYLGLPSAHYIVNAHTNLPLTFIYYVKAFCVTDVSIVCVAHNRIKINFILITDNQECMDFPHKLLMPHRSKSITELLLLECWSSWWLVPHLAIYLWGLVKDCRFKPSKIVMMLLIIIITLFKSQNLKTSLSTPLYLDTTNQTKIFSGMENLEQSGNDLCKQNEW